MIKPNYRLQAVYMYSTINGPFTLKSVQFLLGERERDGEREKDLDGLRDLWRGDQRGIDKDVKVVLPGPRV